MVAKNLERLFPVDTKMVVIIDDRGDVWKWNANLLRVKPYEFFIGIGDINSSFLPKKQEIQPTAKIDAATPQDTSQPVEQESVTNGGSQSNGVAEDTSGSGQEVPLALEHLIALSGSDDPAVREMQNKGQEEIISTQLEEKPLLKMQQQQDEKDDAEAANSTGQQTNGEPQPSQATDSDSDSSESSITAPSRPKNRHSILKNDDEELIHLERSLTNVHTAFFKEWDKRRLAGKGGRVGALSGKRKPPLPNSEEEEAPNDLSLVPDVKKVMPSMKARVLSGVTLVFSGVLPLGTDIQNADISTWAKTFGATVTDKVTRDVTHVIAARAGTAKVKIAVKRGIKVVGTDWLTDSMQRWRKLEEKPYLLEGAGKQKIDETSDNDGQLDNAIMAGDFMLSSSEGESSGVDTEGDEPVRKKPRLEIATGNGELDLTDDEEAQKTSPLTLDTEEWANIDAELKEFLGSDAESESDAESVSSGLSLRAKRKRNRDTVAAEDELLDGIGSSNSKGSGGSRLKAVANASSDRGSTDSNTPTPLDEDSRIAEAQREAEQRDMRQQADEEDSDDELARQLENGLEEGDDQNIL
jgi:RNA polymerase II subunit A-like phosphatase